ncbi:methyltransferase, partial [Fischerella thermalis CCMEE 5328]
MAKQYVSTAYLQQHDSKLYAIFAWSQRQAAIIPAKSWLTVMEIFVHEHSLEQAYQIFQEIKLAPTVNQVIDEINKYADLLSNAIVFV